MRFLGCILGVLLATSLFAEEELPTNPEEPLDIEPPLLIQETPNRNIVATTPGAPLLNKQDPARLELALEKAKKSAAAGERLFRAGIIAKVDAENRALKVVRLEAELAAARVEAATQELTAQQERIAAGEIPEVETEAAKAALLAKTREAEAAAAKKEQAELEAARINLQRQKKLLAMGSGRKSEVNRAEEKVTTLQQKN